MADKIWVNKLEPARTRVGVRSLWYHDKVHVCVF